MYYLIKLWLHKKHLTIKKIFIMALYIILFILNKPVRVETNTLDKNINVYIF